MKIDKAEVIRAFIAHFEHDISTLETSANAAHEEATHEETKAEDQHDTRAIEASYLAAGQSQRIADLRKVLYEMKSYLDTAHLKIEEARPGSLMMLETNGKTLLTFFAKQGGGAVIHLENNKISITTPLSPLGQALLNATPGDEVTIDTKTGSQEYTIRKIF